MQKTFDSQNLLKKLPKPFCISDDEINSTYHSLYEKLVESYEKCDFHRIFNLINDSDTIIKFKPTLSEDFKVKFINQLYEIITIYPVKYYMTQLRAVSFLNKFLGKNKRVKGLKLNWKPFYKVMKYYTLNNESFFIRGSDFNESNSINSRKNNSLTCLIELSMKISKYFPDEIETENGKTTTTELLVKKFIPQISANGQYTTAYLLYFRALCPPHKGRYKVYLNYLLNELNDTSKYQTAESIFAMILQSICCNIEDDFSYLIPVVSELISTKVFQNKTSNFPNRDIISSRFFQLSLQQPNVQLLPNILIELFISPPTRKTVLDLLECFSISFKSVVHPSSSNGNPINLVIFLDHLVCSLSKSLRKLSSKKEPKFYFNMKEELGPSKDEIHQFLSITSEMRIMNISKCFNYEPILIETKLDPSTIDRYFEIGIECINLMDAYSVAKSGWTIMTALMNSIDKYEKIRENFESLFQFAIDNLYRQELQLVISHFLNIALIKVPFNRNKTLEGCEFINFPTLAYSFFSTLINILKSLPSMNGETTTLNQSFSESIILSIITLLQYCDDEVMSELLPIFTSLPYDEDVAHCAYFVEIMTANYCFFATKEQTEAIVNKFKRQLKLQNNHSMFNFLTTILSTSSISNQKTFDSAKQTTDLLLKYTKSEDEKIRKIAWKSILYALNIFNRIVNVKVTLKLEKMKENPLENACLDDFNIEWISNPDLSNLAFEIFDPVFDKLLTIKDSVEINNLLNEVGDEISCAIQLITQFTDGSIEKEINEGFINPIRYIPDVYPKSMQLRDKLIKCALRIIKDFKENDIIISHIINICNGLFTPYFNIKNTKQRESMQLLNQFFKSYDNSKNNYNSCFLYNSLVTQFNNRKQMFIIPLTNELKELLLDISELLDSKYQSVKNSCFHILQNVLPFYNSLTKSIIENMINKADSIQINTIISFFNLMPILDFLINNDELLCKTMLIILNNFDMNDKLHINDLKMFMLNACIFEFSFETPKENNKEYTNLLKKIKESYLNKNQNIKTYNYILILIIFLSMKRVYDVDNKIIEFILKSFTQFDNEIADIAVICFSNAMKRKIILNKERIQVNQFPTIPDFPNILDQVSVILKENGVYFPVTLKTFSSRELLFELNEDYSLEKMPINTKNINKSIIEINEDVKNVFESFKNIEIKWNINEDNKVFDSEFLYDQSNGHYMFKRSFYHKKYQFNNNEILIKNIPYIISSATNSINENNLYSCVRYLYIWEQFALTVGPYSINPLNKILVNFVSQYYSINAIVTSKILFDLIAGFMKNICYWNIDDRISFFKLIALPSITIISLNRNTVPFAEHIITMGNIYNNPFCFAPLIKILYELSPQSANGPLYNRYLISIISKQPSIRPFQFYNSIDQLKTKFIVPFINQMNEYSTNEMNDIIHLAFSLLNCCSFSYKQSPIYSMKVESKKHEILEMFEDIIVKNENKSETRRILIHVFTFLFINFDQSSFDLRSILSPIFIKHLHTIFNLLNSSNIKDEDKFINSVSSFIGDTIFISNTQMEFEFVSSLIKEMMNSSLPMQLILLEPLNKMFECNIFNIPKEDYPKYEDLLLKYGNYEKTKNFGNELRMKIAKILGIFEIRNCTLNCDIFKEKVDPKLIDNEVLKAASIILNSFLFDHADERVTKAFDLMEECCTVKNSKSRDFFKNVSKIFIDRHTEHVIKDAENMLIQYKNMLTPSYLC